MSKPERVTIFPNGNVAVWDENGQQVAELQDSFFNYKYIDRLAKAIANDGLEVENMGFNPSDLWLRVDHYRKYTKLAQSAPANDKGDSIMDILPETPLRIIVLKEKAELLDIFVKHVNQSN